MSVTSSGKGSARSVAERLRQLAPERRRLLGALITQHTFAQAPDSARLVACVVARAERHPQASELTAHLTERLPEYMVPRQFLAVTALPRLANGKLDRRAAVALAGALEVNVSETGTAPTTRAERLLAQIWCDVLGIDEVSVDDNFFELGGDSLLSIRILSRAQSQGLKLSPEQFFDHPTIAAQAAATSEAGPDSVAADEPLIDLDESEISGIAALLDGLESDPGA